MKGSPEDAKALSPEVIAPEAVAAYLRRHPDFLNEHPDLIAALVPPDFDHGESVVDMQHFMLERLRGELAQAKTRERTLLSAAEGNANVQARVHLSVRKLLAARSFEHLIEIVTGELPEILELAATALCVETAEPLPPGARDVGVVVLKPGAIDRLLPAGRDIALKSDTPGDKAVFGSRAGSVRSVAMMRLRFGVGSPAGLFALGAAARDGFDERQGTELLSFLAHVIQNSIRRWLVLGS
ncbi:MAG: DUF484 family protein [Alphaproteobacteria bacterium]|nr:DUF484 family protein [Alphaproteobacteria bacterium]